LKIHLVVNEYGVPVNFMVTYGSCVDCKEATHLINNIDAKLVFPNHAYSTNDISYYLNKQNMTLVIPLKRNRVHQRNYARKLYCSRHIIENTFLALKCWRGISTRYAKTLGALIVSIPVRCIFMLF